MPASEYKLNDYWEFTFPTQTPATGAATDADALPTYRVYEENNDTAVATGDAVKRDDTNTTGYYAVRGQVTALAGYEVEKSYEVRVAAIMGGVTGSAVVGRFKVVAADVARDDVWTDALATTIGTMATCLAGITSLAAWLRGLSRKSTMDATAKTELNTGGGTYDETTDSNEALRERGDAAWVTATGFSTFDPAAQEVTPTTASKTGYALTSGERTSIATAVWASATRTLTSFGTLVADIVAAVWAGGTGDRTLTVTVHDDDGADVADAIVTLVNAAGDTVAGPLPTDNNGQRTFKRPDAETGTVSVRSTVAIGSGSAAYTMSGNTAVTVTVARAAVPAPANPDSYMLVIDVSKLDGNAVMPDSNMTITLIASDPDVLVDATAHLLYAQMDKAYNVTGGQCTIEIHEGAVGKRLRIKRNWTSLAASPQPKEDRWEATLIAPASGVDLYFADCNPRMVP